MSESVNLILFRRYPGIAASPATAEPAPMCNVGAPWRPIRPSKQEQGGGTFQRGP
jgi:hypothetical protein